MSVTLAWAARPQLLLPYWLGIRAALKAPFPSVWCCLTCVNVRQLGWTFLGYTRSGGAQVPIQGEEIAFGKEHSETAPHPASRAVGGAHVFLCRVPLQQLEPKLQSLPPGLRCNGEAGFASPSPC